MTTYRPLYPRLYFAFLGTGPLIVVVGALASMTQTQHGRLAVMVTGMGLAGLYLYRCLALGVDITDDSVRVRNPLASRSFNLSSSSVIQRRFLGFSWLTIVDSAEGEEHFVAATFTDTWLKFLPFSDQLFLRGQAALVDQLLGSEKTPE